MEATKTQNTPKGQHTQGEWKVRFMGGEDDGENMFFVEAPNLKMPKLGYGIEIMMEDFGEHNGYTREQRLADAKLIASAPELLEALQQIVTAHKNKIDIQPYINIAEQEIKKATE